MDEVGILIEPMFSAEKCLEAVGDKLSMLSLDTLNYGSICIHKVPENYRNRNQQAFTPRLVSLGFIHHGGNQVQAMEEYKIKYLNNFLHISGVSLKELVKYVSEEQYLVCRCYEDTCIRSLPGGKDPSEVILLDGVFVVNLFLKNYFVELREEGDLIFDDNTWVYNQILHDMLLFENQLPLRFLHSLYNRFVLEYWNIGRWLDNFALRPPSFIELAHKYFKDAGNTGKLFFEHDFQPARHFVELLSILHKPYDNEKKPKHKVDSGVNFDECPSATELKAAGVKFLKGAENYVHFDPEHGVVRIPALTVLESSETFFYNLIAFEQSGYYHKHITSYIIMLGNLMKTPKDVALLTDYGIICNEYGSTKKVAELFGNLYKDLVVNQDEFLFVSECYQLNRYRRNPWYRLNAKVFKLTPNVKAIGAIAIVTVILTIVSTVCSILQVI